jgi:hypothetical protein
VTAAVGEPSGRVAQPAAAQYPWPSMIDGEELASLAADLESFRVERKA